jgi:DNA-binding Xre family transcriptional regulator
MTMADHSNKSQKSDQDREIVLAEERFLLQTQSAIQKLLNDKDIKYRDLANRLKVSEARISQMFGDEASNLTLRTIAKIFYHLNEMPLVHSQREFDRAIAEAKGTALSASQWRVRAAPNDLMVGDDIDLVDDIEDSRERGRASSTTFQWAQADAARERRRA